MQRSASLITHDTLDFASAWKLQQDLVRERAVDQRPDTLLLLEHDPVYTVGRSGKDEHCRGGETALRRFGFPIYHVERGGSITYHGPGQLVGYPILHLRSHCAGPKPYMRLLEEVIIRVLATWGIEGRRIDKLPGVWVGGEPGQKIAAMGVRITQGVTLHGFALNVSVDLTPFAHIHPCGIAACRVTSMATILGRPLNLHDVRRDLARLFAEVFDLQWISWQESTSPGARVGRISARERETPTAPG